MKTIKRNNGNDIKIYATTLGDVAFEQIKELGEFEPYKDSKIRIMPDCHAGAGCTIGTTMEIKDKITPNLVGVDIGCLDMDTEYLTPDGWKKIWNYSGGTPILVYNKEDDSAYFEKPINYIVKECDDFYEFKNKKGLDLLLSEEHKILIWKGYKSKGYRLEDVKPIDLFNLGNKLDGGYYGIKTSFNFINNPLDLSDNEIRLDIMISADGCVRRESDGLNHIELHFSKKRKIDRAIEILNSCNITYNKTISTDNTTYFYFKVKNIFNKDLSKYYNASSNQLQIVAKESLLWDGHKGYRSYYSSTQKTNADVIQFAFASINIRAGISTVYNGDNNWKNNYIVTPTKNNVIGITNNINKVKSVDGKKYCFTVSTGYFIIRRNGKMSITGNCGMLTLKLKESEIDLQKLDAVINEFVPNGFNIHSEPKADFDFDKLLAKNLNIGRAALSIGSLGGGNHFIEVGKNSKGELFLVIHSGSRNIGGQVAKHYQDIAIENLTDNSKEREELIERLKKEGKQNEIGEELKKLKKPVINKDLAYLTGADFDNYMHDMELMQKFAVLNRRTMANIVLDKAGLTEAEAFETIHNYIDFKRMILRKGAVSAENGETLLIPINMRDGSIIAKGKGNEDWNFSAPHGAGRLMGRNEAHKKLNFDEFKEQMKDVYSTSVLTETLDESPNAYKSMNEIIEAIGETVEIIDIIKPIYNFKAH